MAPIAGLHGGHLHVVLLRYSASPPSSDSGSSSLIASLWSSGQTTLLTSRANTTSSEVSC